MLDREIREDQARPQSDRLLSYSQIQGITGAYLNGQWVDRSQIDAETWATVPKPKAYREQEGNVAVDVTSIQWKDCVTLLPDPGLPPEVWKALWDQRENR